MLEALNSVAMVQAYGNNLDLSSHNSRLFDAHYLFREINQLTGTVSVAVRESDFQAPQLRDMLGIDKLTIEPMRTPGKMVFKLL